MEGCLVSRDRIHRDAVARHALEQVRRNAQVLEGRLRENAPASLDDALGVEVLVGVDLVGPPALAGYFVVRPRFPLISTNPSPQRLAA